MSVEVVRRKYTIVRAGGSIDISNVQQFRAALENALVDSPKSLIIDLTDAYYADSAGVQAFIYAYQRMRSWGGQLALVTGNPNMKEIIGIVHLDILPGMYVCEDMLSAEKALGDQQAEVAGE